MVELIGQCRGCKEMLHGRDTHSGAIMIKKAKKPRVKDTYIKGVCENCKVMSSKLMRYKECWVCPDCLYPDDKGIDRSEYGVIKSSTGFII